jgi:hypothetical protein
MRRYFTVVPADPGTTVELSEAIGGPAPLRVDNSTTTTSGG